MRRFHLPTRTTAWGAVCILITASSCSGMHAHPDAGGTPVDPTVYEPPVALIYTPDLVSRFEQFDRGLWVAGLNSALAFTLTHFAPDPEGPLAGRPAGEAQSLITSAILAGITLVRVRDGVSVPGEARQGLFDVTGAEQALGVLPGEHQEAAPFSFVPSGALEEGWYVFRVDLSGARAFLPIEFADRRPWQREGDVLFARVYAGSRPMWGRASVSCAFSVPRCEIGVWFTESTAAEAAVVTIRYDGVVVDCSPTTLPHGIVMTCPDTPDGTRIAVDFESTTIVDVDGEPLLAGDTTSVAVTVERAMGMGFTDPELGLGIVRSGR